MAEYSPTQQPVSMGLPLARDLVLGYNNQACVTTNNCSITIATTLDCRSEMDLAVSLSFANPQLKHTSKLRARIYVLTNAHLFQSKRHFTLQICNLLFLNNQCLMLSMLYFCTISKHFSRLFLWNDRNFSLKIVFLEELKKRLKIFL